MGMSQLKLSDTLRIMNRPAPDVLLLTISTDKETYYNFLIKIWQMNLFPFLTTCGYYFYKSVFPVLTVKKVKYCTRFPFCTQSFEIDLTYLQFCFSLVYVA